MVDSVAVAMLVHCEKVHELIYEQGKHFHSSLFLISVINFTHSNPYSIIETDQKHSALEALF